jgi:hypothetical protein
MAKLDMAKLGKDTEATAAVRHEASMKRKRDELMFELFAKCQHTATALTLLDDNARIDCYKRHSAEKQLDLDQRRHAFERQVLADNAAEHARAAEIAHAAADDLHALYVERQKKQTDMKTLLEQDRVLLDQRAALLDEKEEILRSSTYVCSICTLACAEGTVRALDPCGHCLCAACVVACGIVLDGPSQSFLGACPTCRSDVDDVLRIFP